MRATDSFGTSTETSVTVTVDNVPFGKVSAVVSAGAPVDGLTVRVVAIDDATGLPVTGRLGGPILGQSTDLTADGSLLRLEPRELHRPGADCCRGLRRLVRRPLE